MDQSLVLVSVSQTSMKGTLQLILQIVVVKSQKKPLQLRATTK